MTVKTKQMLRQVKLVRRSPRGHTEDVAWIDNKLAKPNARVRDEDGRIWTVSEVYNAKPFDDVDKVYEQWRDFARKLDRGGH